MSSEPRLSVIIPTYNESENIPILIERLTQVLARIPHEIMVVDDNSPDRTWEVAENIAAKNPAVRVIRRLNEKGLSSAVLTGMAVARGSVFAVMDGDLQHDEGILPDMFRAIEEEGHDVAIGSRGVEGGGYGSWSKRRRFMSAVAASMAKIVLTSGINDPMSGFFAVSRDCYRESGDRINPRGFKILLEFVGRTRGLKIKEVGYTFKNRIHGETKLSASVIRNYIVALFDIRFGKYISPTFLLYSFVGTTGVVVNLVGFELGKWMKMPAITTGLGKYFDPLDTAVPFGYQLAIISNYLLNNYITFYEKRRKGLENLWGFTVFEFISLFGFIVHTGTYHLLHNNGFMEGAMSETLRELTNNGIATVVALVSNYFLNLHITWGRER